MIISFLRGDKRVDSSTNSAFYVMAQNVYFWNDWRQLLKCWICPIYSWTVYLFINFFACYGSKLLLLLLSLLLLLLCRSMKLWNAVHIMSSIGRKA